MAQLSSQTRAAILAFVVLVIRTASSATTWPQLAEAWLKAIGVMGPQGVGGQTAHEERLVL